MDAAPIKSEPEEVVYEEEYHAETKCGNIFRRTDQSYFFVCEFCEETFDGMAPFAFHLESKHFTGDTESHKYQPAQDVKTEILDASFEAAQNIKVEQDDQNIKVEQDDGSQNQPVEDLTFSEAQDVENQMQVAGQPTEEDDATNWTEIDEEFDSYSETSVHNYQIVCEFCNVSFLVPRVLRAHVVMEHGNRIPKIFQDDPTYLACERCNQKFETPLERYKHEKMHTSCDPYHCPECPKIFPTLHRRESHLPIHRDIRPFGCDLCGKSFKRKSSMNKHREIHKGKTYKCEQCDEVFRSQSNLRHHLYKHSDVRYKCEHCNKECVSLTLLKVHLKTHSNERPFECSLCKARMKHSKSLKKHLRKHELNKEQGNEATANKPFICDVCGMGCVSASNLNRHKHIKHGDKRK